MRKTNWHTLEFMYIPKCANIYIPMYYIPKRLNFATFLPSKDNKSLDNHVKKKYSGKQYVTKISFSLVRVRIVLSLVEF